MRSRAVVALLVASCARVPLVTAPETALDPATYGSLRELPLADRIAPAPDALVAWINEANVKDGFPPITRAYAPGAEERAVVKAALSELPGPVVALASEHLAGLFFVSDLGGTGFTEALNKGPDGSERAVIVLDRLVFQRRANDWATWKESSPFRPGDPSVRLRIEDDAHDDTRGSLQFIFLHELGHLVGLTTHQHASWLREPVVAPFPFVALDWSISDGKYAARPPDPFPERAGLRFYASPEKQSDPALLLTAHERLAGTDFPTLYAATSVFDDFAETFASYVHVVQLGRPYEVEIRRGGALVARRGNGITEPRCAAKRAIIEALLGR